MSKNKVCIYMSTYNGEKYIAEQIDSILNQKNVDVFLCIRDDGSTDNTLKILENYTINHENILMIKGENIGFENSFAEVSRIDIEADYYAFSDQDDYWFIDRLDNAIKLIEKSEGSSLYGSDFLITDSKLNPIRLLYGDNFVNFNNIIQTYGIVGGNMFACTMVWNKSFQNSLLKYKPSIKVSQDVWTQLVAEIVGANIILDKEPTIYHRLHSNNTAGITTGFFALLKKAYKIYYKNVDSTKNKIVKEALDNYNSLDNFGTKSVLRGYVLNYPYSLITKIKLIFSDCFKSKEIKRRFFFSLLVLLNRY